MGKVEDYLENNKVIKVDSPISHILTNGVEVVMYEFHNYFGLFAGKDMLQNSPLEMISMETERQPRPRTLRRFWIGCNTLSSSCLVP